MEQVQDYGGNQVAYRVHIADGWLELEVLHRNLSMRTYLSGLGSPSQLLTRQPAFARSNIRAQQFWLAQVMHDYHTYFSEDRVRIRLR